MSVITPTANERLWNISIPGETGWLLVQSDTHEDSPYCRRELVDAALAMAVERMAICLHFGDLFDAMGGIRDRRRAESGLRDEDRTDDYFDAIVRNMVSRRARYPLIGLFGLGNHETAMLHHQQTDLLARFVAGYSQAAGVSAVRAGYDGYIRVRLGDSKPILIYWHHGSGGSAPVTRGVIKSARRAVYLPDPDFVITGHIHHAWMVPIARETIGRGVGRKLQWHLQCPGYLDTDQCAWGYAKKHEMAPVPFGCWWLRLERDGHQTRAFPVPDFH